MKACFTRLSDHLNYKVFDADILHAGESDFNYANMHQPQLRQVNKVHLPHCDFFLISLKLFYPSILLSCEHK